MAEFTIAARVLGAVILSYLLAALALVVVGMLLRLSLELFLLGWNIL